MSHTGFFSLCQIHPKKEHWSRDFIIFFNLWYHVGGIDTFVAHTQCLRQIMYELIAFREELKTSHWDIDKLQEMKYLFKC